MLVDREYYLNPFSVGILVYCLFVRCCKARAGTGRSQTRFELEPVRARNVWNQSRSDPEPELLVSGVRDGRSKVR